MDFVGAGTVVNVITVVLGSLVGLALGASVVLTDPDPGSAAAADLVAMRSTNSSNSPAASCGPAAASGPTATAAS